MLTFGVPVLVTLVLWWASTGALLYVLHRKPALRRGAMAVLSLAALAAIGVLFAIRDEMSAGAAYAGFSAALVLWGWHELTFLFGLITGPRTVPLADGASGSARLIPAIATVIYHELALFLTLAGLYALLHGSPNEVGLWAFAILWVMRLSSKFNIYLGVANITEQFLPPHLTYLKSYFRRRSMNVLFPFSVTVATAACVMLVLAAAEPGAAPFEVAGLTLLATLLALGILEHWFMVLPIPSEALWKWGLAPPRTERTELPRGRAEAVVSPSLAL